MYTITPMVVALGPQREKSRFTYMHNFGDKVDIPYVSWLIRGEDRVILVDAGCSADDYRTQIRGDGPLMLAGERFQDVVDVKPIEEHFQDQGLTFDDVDTFLQTHLDWDHCMNTPKFRKSRILIQKAEWERIPVHPLFNSTYAPKAHYEVIGGLNVEFVEGDVEISRGVRTMLTPGHSPGGQSVVVDTDDGTYVIAGMCTIRENFYPPEEVLAKGTYKVIPTGMHIDPILCYDSMLRILDVGKDRVLPFHDDAVLTMGTLGCKPSRFDYHAPVTIEEACDLLARYGEDAKVLAGGQSLGPLMNLRLASPAVVVDVNRVDGLDGVGERNGELRLGALVRQRVLERDGRIRRACPMLAQAAPLIGHVAIRNRGTVGGSLAHADPAAELPAIATALGATVELASVRGTRALGAAELFVMPLVTTIEPDELLVSVRLPAAAPRTGQAWLEVSERHGDFALAGVGASVSLAADGTVAEVRLACAGVAPVPFDAQDAAAVLVGEAPSPELVAEAGERAAAACEPASDAHASEAFRRRLAGVLTRRALTRAVEDAASR